VERPAVRARVAPEPRPGEPALSSSKGPRPPNVSPARKGWDINPQEEPSAVGAAHSLLNLHPYSCRKTRDLLSHWSAAMLRINSPAANYHAYHALFSHFPKSLERFANTRGRCDGVLVPRAAYDAHRSVVKHLYLHSIQRLEANTLVVTRGRGYLGRILFRRYSTPTEIANSFCDTPPKRVSR
jgi:hypothetical protein